jgi:V8-like Glu-specific endopeptidase
MMKLFFTFLFYLVILAGCTSYPKKFPRDKYSATDGIFSPPNTTHLTQVKGLPQEPYDSICRQQINRKNWWGITASDRTSSSTYLTGGILLTAGHNFGDSILAFSTAKDFHLECQTGYASPESEILSYDSFQASSGPLEYVHPAYYFSFAFINKKFGSDASLVKLCPLANGFTSSFRLATLDEIAFFSHAVNIEDADSKPTIFVAGYPHGSSMVAGIEAINGKFDGSRLMHIETVATRVSSDGVIDYGFRNTVGGMSGGPVWIKKGTEYVIVGVHVTNGGAFLLDKSIIEQYMKLRAMSCV